MTQQNSRLCSRCQAEVPAGFPDGLCPHCLMTDAVAVGGEGLAQGKASPERRFTATSLQRRFPDLEIIRLLGRGGMGVVFLARQKKLDRQVALKVLTPPAGRNESFALRFEQEARLLAKLQHPNIVSLIDSGEIDRSAEGEPPLYYLLMEYVDGESLDRTIQRDRLDSEQATAFAIQVCEALSHAHRKGVTHRDIKPANLLIDRQDHLQVADFGLAILAEDAQAPLSTALTATGSSLGTPLYMAPENWNDPGAVDHRADLYSLGVVFYEMLTGDRPGGVFAPPSKEVGDAIDARIDPIVMKALAKKPSDRYQDADSLRKDLTGILEPPGLLSRSKLLFGSLAVGALMGLLTLVALFPPWGKQDPKPAPSPALPSSGAPANDPASTATALLPIPDLASPGSLVGFGHAEALLKAQSFQDFVQVVIEPHTRNFAILRSNGEVISNLPWLRRKKDVSRLCHSVGFAENIVGIHRDGSFSYAGRRYQVDADHPIVCASLSDRNGLLLLDNGEAKPWWDPRVPAKDRWQPPDPETLQNVKAIAAVRNASAVLKESGEVIAWNENGEIPLPPELGQGIRKIRFWAYRALMALDENENLWVCSSDGKLNEKFCREGVTDFEVGSLNSYPRIRDLEGRWRLFPEFDATEERNRPLIQELPRVAGLPAEAFDLSPYRPAKSEPVFLWINPAVDREVSDP